MGQKIAVWLNLFLFLKGAKSECASCFEVGKCDYDFPVDCELTRLFVQSYYQQFFNKSLEKCPHNWKSPSVHQSKLSTCSSATCIKSKLSIRILSQVAPTKHQPTVLTRRVTTEYPILNPFMMLNYTGSYQLYGCEDGQMSERITMLKYKLEISEQTELDGTYNVEGQEVSYESCYAPLCNMPKSMTSSSSVAKLSELNDFKFKLVFFHVFLYLAHMLGIR